ncbi:MAG: toprim domain-containing protein [Rhodomicrobium sp.]
MSLARTLTAELGGDWHGRYGLTPGPGHSARDRSLRISPHATDPDDIVVHSFAGDDVLELKKAWREEGLLPRRGQTCHVIDPVILAKRKIEAQKRYADEMAKQRDKALWIWDRSKPAPGTIVEEYLRRRTGLDTPPLDTTRYLPSAPPKYPYPSMVCAFGLPAEPQPGALDISRNAIQGIHLTRLLPDGSWKAPVEKDKTMLGNIKGWPIVLFPPGDSLALLIGEGIESALACRLDLGYGIWAAGSASNMTSALADKIPSYIESVHVVRDFDVAGVRGAEAVLCTAHARGFECFIYKPELVR